MAGKKNGNGNGNYNNGNNGTDWEAIEREYRAGLLSVREIARQCHVSHTAISKKAKANGWLRDLGHKIQKAVAGKVIKKTLPEESAKKESEIIEAAAERGANIIVAHQESIKKSQALVALFQDQLLEAAKQREELEDAIYDETAKSGKDGKPDYKRRNAMLKAVSLPSHAAILKNLAASQKDLIQLERQAYDLDDRPPEGEEIPVIPIEFVDPPAREDDDGNT